MFNAFNIKTSEIIATERTRDKAATKAIKLVGSEGYFIRPVKEEAIRTPANWATSDGEWWI